MSSKVVYEGWMVRYGRRKIGRSFIHMRYFVLESRLLAYYKRKPQDNQVPIKTLLIDGNCRVEDRGLKTHHGHMVYVLSVYNKKEKYHRITMAAFNIQEALIWKEKIEYVIDQHQGAQPSNGNKYISFEYKSGMDNGKTASSSDRESQFSAPEDEDEPHPNLSKLISAGGGFNISPLKPRNGRPRTQVQHLMQIDLKGWGVGYVSSFQQHCLRQMLNSVAGLREWFAQTDERNALPRIPVMVNMSSASVSSKKSQKPNEAHPNSLDQVNAAVRNSALMDEYSDEDEDFQIAESEQEAYPGGLENDIKRTVLEEEPADEIDLSSFSGNLRRDDRDNARDCWKISDGNNFRVRSKHFCFDKSKVPAGKHLLDLVAVDWFKDSKRMDHVAKRQGCAAQVASEKGFFSIIFNLQVPGSTHYSMVFYFVTKELVPGSLLQRFVDGDDEFRNSRLKLIPSVPKGSWIVRQSVGSTPCLLGKAVDCNYIRGAKYLEIDVDIGSSTVANGVLGLVVGVITTLVVDMAFLVQANTPDELPERLIGAVRISHLELKSAIVPKLDPDPS
ncbi:hypothetical protein AAHE18_15G015500 [Arachis hypogaea]